MRRSKPASHDEFFPGFTEVVEIGVGSLATVYRAREIGTNRLVALKLLNVRDASPRALESFERESIALGAVSSHPNIVTLFRSFRAADERPVLVLELCRGSVGDRMHGGAGFPVTDVVALGIKIAGALETAHRAQILHRDVKPQNILVTEFGEPALADFGVAMLQSSTQTTAGLFDFTTLHAAPELLEGGATSAATDVYELASTLYQLIAGRAAFRAYEGESPASVILRILRDPVQPLLNTQAPASLSDLLLYAMSKDKGSRPPTAAEFAAELAAVEVEQQWPRTQFLIRDASGGTSGLPTITRMPDARRRIAPPPPAPVLPPTPPVLPPAAPVLPPTPPVLPPGPPDEPTVVSAALEPPPTTERVVIERQVIERLVFEPRPVTDDAWSEVSIVQVRPDEPEPEPAQTSAPPAVPKTVETQPVETQTVETQTVEPDLLSVWGEVADVGPGTHPPEPATGDPRGGQSTLDDGPPPQYPIPPSGVVDDPPLSADADPGSVPTWALRAAAPAAAAPVSYGDLSLDPMSLRRKVSLRAGTSSLVVDDSGLALRTRLHRSSIPWREVLGFEPRFDEGGREAWLVVFTRSGPVELAATRRPAGEVRYLHALLDAYRQRAAMLGSG